MRVGFKVWYRFNCDHNFMLKHGLTQVHAERSALFSVMLTYNMGGVTTQVFHRAKKHFKCRRLQLFSVVQSPKTYKQHLSAMNRGDNNKARSPQNADLYHGMAFVLDLEDKIATTNWAGKI